MPADGAGSLSFMADDATRDCAKRMHCLASFSCSDRAGGGALAAAPYDCRDRIVLGNRKLTYRAVQKWAPASQLADDMAAECQIVLIKAVAAFNPWLGIRFSTYAFTCLMRPVPTVAASGRRTGCPDRCP